MWAVSAVRVYRNDFKGTLPEAGIRTMRAVTTFAIYTNSFEGALPESGLQERLQRNTSGERHPNDERSHEI
eukprot:4892607-Amphidinium_carterae.1